MRRTGKNLGERNNRRPAPRRKFEAENNELFRKLHDKNEKERLWAIVKLEEKFYGSGIPRKFVDSLLYVVLNDESAIVRAAAIRALYHESSESWPYGPEDRKKVLQVIMKKVSSSGIDGIDQHVAYEIQEIEDRLNWLRR